MTRFTDPTFLSVLIHLVVFGSVAVRVIMARPSPGVALAWLLIVAVVPLLGLLLYLLFGERRIGGRRAARLAALRPDVDDIVREIVDGPMADVDWSQQPPGCVQMDQLGRSLVGVPTLTRNRLELHSDTLDMLRAIARDEGPHDHLIALGYAGWAAGQLEEAIDEIR
mgnify:CR=1 FL=1